MTTFVHDLDVVVSSRIRLARNFPDLPFSTTQSEAIANMCVDRTIKALEGTQDENGNYALVKMADLPLRDRLSLVESHLISRDLMGKPEAGAALIRKDNAMSLMINEEDHLRLQSILPGAQLSSAADQAYMLEDILQKELQFAYDAQLGYLTACPTNTGTGMRASLMLHLPMLTLFKQMGNVTQSVAKLGLTIRGIYGEGSEALGNLYQVSNQVTLGRTEDEIVQSVTAVGKQIIEMERNLRKKAFTGENSALDDQVFRSLGALKYARRMDVKEFMKHWSNLRLGVSAGLLQVTLEVVDELLSTAQDAHVMQSKEADLRGRDLDIARSTLIRRMLSQVE